MELNTINLCDNLEFLKTLPDNSVDAIITDSPYGLSKKQPLLKILQAWITTGYLEITGKGFMGKTWDAFVPQPIFWKECYRVLKPGAYCVSFFGCRTYHLGTTAMEIAGFEVRDQYDWIFATGMPKSKENVKPAHEPIAICRKPGGQLRALPEDCRLERGSLPGNIMFDEEAAEQFDNVVGIRKSGGGRKGEAGKRCYEKTLASDVYAPIYTKGGERFWDEDRQDWYSFTDSYNDEGGPSRYFYVSKASPTERAGSKLPTIKPLNLMIQLVKLFCPVGGICLDPHGGSGPTAEACLETGRHYILVDNDPNSIADANARVGRWHKKKAA